MSAMMLVMGGLYEVQLKIIKNKVNREMSAKLGYLVESAEELANYYAKTHGAGVNSAADPEWESKYMAELSDSAAEMGLDYNGCPGNDSALCEIQVVGRAPVDKTVKLASLPTADFFSAPMRGTGSAGEKCDELNATNSPALNDADNPCNWDRLYVGQNAGIPLYYVDINGNRVMPAGAASVDFRLRVRTPSCSNPSSLNGCINGRIELFPPADNASYLYPDRDPVLVQWMIRDENGSSTVVAYDKYDTKVDDERDPLLNTEISSGRVNKMNVSNFFIVLIQGDEGKDTKGRSLSPKISDLIMNDNKPVLSLNLVTIPQRNHNGTRNFNYTSETNNDLNDSSFNVPYLEYQVLSGGGSPMADGKSYITGDMKVGDFGRKLNRGFKRPTNPSSGYAIESF